MPNAFPMAAYRMPNSSRAARPSKLCVIAFFFIDYVLPGLALFYRKNGNVWHQVLRKNFIVYFVAPAVNLHPVVLL